MRAGSGGLDDVTTLVEQWPDLAPGVGDGACDDAEEFSEDVLGGAEALAQHGDQGLSGEGECGRVPAGWFAAGRPAGVSWHKLASPCATPYAAAGLAAYDQQRITLLCQGNGAAGSLGKIWYSSDDGGRIFARVSQWFGPGTYGPVAQPGPDRAPSGHGSHACRAALRRPLNGRTVRLWSAHSIRTLRGAECGALCHTIQSGQSGAVAGAGAVQRARTVTGSPRSR